MMENDVGLYIYVYDLYPEQLVDVTKSIVYDYVFMNIYKLQFLWI